MKVNDNNCERIFSLVQIGLGPLSLTQMVAMRKSLLDYVHRNIICPLKRSLSISKNVDEIGGCYDRSNKASVEEKY